MANGHSSLSPSAAERWMTCPGSVHATEGMVDQSSIYADEGTGAHALLEVVLLEKYDVFDNPNTSAYCHVGRKFNVADKGREPVFITVDNEMAEHVQSVVDYVERRVAEMSTGPDGSLCTVQMFSERRVSPEWLVGSDQHDGTTDITLVSPYEIEIVDLKYGRGVVVEVGTLDEPNPQFMLYLIGSIPPAEYQVASQRLYRITAAQPRAYHPDGPIRSLTGITVEDISAFAERVKECRDAVTPDAPRVASANACQFCKARRGGQRVDGSVVTPCRVYAEWAAYESEVPVDFASESYLDTVQAFATRDPATLAPEEVVRILKGADILKGFLNALEEWGHEALSKGYAPPEISAAFKLVNGRSNRRWSFENEDSVATELMKKLRWVDPVTGKTTGLGKKDIYNAKLKSPTQVEALLKAAAKGNANFTSTHWEAFRRLVTKPEGALQMVPVSDDRPAAGSKDVSGAFADVPPTPALQTDMFN